MGSKNVAQAQKLMVLDLLKKVCSNPQILVDIFLNYDCDPQALDSNLFETIVNDLTKILQAKIEILDPQIGPSIEDLKIKERVTTFSSFHQTNFLLPLLFFPFYFNIIYMQGFGVCCCYLTIVGQLE